MTEIAYLTGDATNPMSGPAIIAHVCNDGGRWGAGFSGAVGRKWPIVEQCYRQLAHGSGYGLGSIQVVTVTTLAIPVVNMIAARWVQNGRYGRATLDTIALDECLERLGGLTSVLQRSVHMPRIGCGLAGGNWEEVEEIISRRLLREAKVQVFIYNLPARHGFGGRDGR